MSEIKTSIVVDLAGNLARKSRQLTKSMSRFTGRSSRGLTTMRKNIKKSSRDFNRFGRLMGGLAVGAGMVKAIKSSMGLEERFERLGIQANKSTAEMEALKKKIFDTAQAPGIRVDNNKILEAVVEIVEMTGDLKFAEKNIRNIGVALQATGANGKSIGGVGAELNKWDIKKPKEVIAALDLLNAQGKQGAFTLQNIAALGPRLFAAYGTTGTAGLKGVRDMGATLQVIRKGTGSSEQATTAFEALIRTFNDADQVEKLQKAGIQLYDLEALKRGEKILRPLNQLIIEITTRAKGDATIISKFFDAEALRSFNTTIGEFKRTKTIKSFDKFLDIKADGGQTIADSARMARTSSSGLTSVGTKIQQGADDIISKPLKATTSFLNNDLGGTLVHMMANMGNDEAQRAIELQRGKGTRGIKNLFEDDKPSNNSRVRRPVDFAPTNPAGNSGTINRRVDTVVDFAPTNPKGNSLADDIGTAVARELNNKEAKITVSVESKDGSKAIVKKISSKNMQVDVDSALAVGGVQ